MKNISSGGKYHWLNLVPADDQGLIVLKDDGGCHQDQTGLNSKSWKPKEEPSEPDICHLHQGLILQDDGDSSQKEEGLAFQPVASTPE